MANPIVSMEWLARHLEDKDVVIADCRFELTNPEVGRAEYEQSHIPWAVYFDLDRDLANPKGKHGGRHPLPDLDTFVEKLGRAGIDHTKKVVIYDNQNGSFAARLWWMLRYLGHEESFVLDVSYSTWMETGYPTSSGLPNPEPRTFTPYVREKMAVDVQEVKDRMAEHNVVLVDSRAPERYRGDKEPMDPKAGHIPGAENWFWKENVADNGKWKSQKELKGRFQAIEDKDLIVYCGSGVTASANVLALKAAGKDAQLYVGSWSDWSSYSDHPVETGDREN